MDNKTIGNIIIKAGEQIKSGKCGLDEEEISSIIELVTHKKMYIADVCKYLGCCQKTLENMVSDGRLPEWRKEAGGKKYLWRDEIEKHIKQNNEKDINIKKSW